MSKTFTEKLIQNMATMKLASIVKEADVLDSRGIPYKDLLKLSPRQLAEIAYSVPQYDVIPILDEFGNRVSLGAGLQGEAFPVMANPAAGFSAKFIDNPNPKLKQIANASLKFMNKNQEMMFPGQLELQKHFMSGNSPYINTLFARGDFGGIGGKDSIVTQMLIAPEAFGISRKSPRYAQIINLWNRIMNSETFKNTGGRFVPSDMHTDQLMKIMFGNDLSLGKLKDPTTGKLVSLTDIVNGSNISDHNFGIHPELERGLSYDPMFVESNYGTRLMEEGNRLRRRGISGITSDLKALGQKAVDKGQSIVQNGRNMINEVADKGVAPVINNAVEQGKTVLNNGVKKVQQVANQAPDMAYRAGEQMAKNVKPVVENLINQGGGIINSGIKKLQKVPNIFNGAGSFLRRIIR